MAAETVVIDIMTNFKDNASGTGVDSLSKKLDQVDKSVQKLIDDMNRLNKMSARPSIEIEDRAVTKIDKVKTTLYDLKGKTISTTLKIVDKFTSPLRSLKNKLFSIKTLITGIVAGAAIKKAVLDPIGLADAYSGAKIGFQTLLGEKKGQNLMDQLDQFAKATPFKTSNTISQAQRMIAMGWDAENIVNDMTVIGDAAASTGKGDEGLQRIVTALAQIKSKGKLSSEELNQLAEAGIKAKQYIAEGLGYGSGDKGVQALSGDLQKGKVGAEEAIQAIMQGMKEYQGMMDTTANETVEGLKSQIEDTFEINIFRKWGQGLQDGAKKGLGSIVKLLDASEDGLSKFGDLLKDAGSTVSNWAAGKMETSINKLLELTEKDSFKNADLFGKVKIAWSEVVAEPFGEWWDSTGRDYITEKVTNLGKNLGSGANSVITTLLGLESPDDVIGDATSVGTSFAKGFIEGFQGADVWSQIKEKVSESLKDGLDPTNTSASGWLTKGLAIFGGSKLLSGIAGSGILGTLFPEFAAGAAEAGVVGAAGAAEAAGAAGALGSGALVGTASAAAGLGIPILAMLGTLGGLSFFKSGISDYNTGEKYGLDEKKKEGAGKAGGALGGAITGGAIGTAIAPGIGTLLGGALGSVVGGYAGWALSGTNTTSGGGYDAVAYANGLDAAREKTEALAQAQDSAVSSGDAFKEKMISLATTGTETGGFFDSFAQSLADNLDESTLGVVGETAYKNTDSSVQSAFSGKTINTKVSILVDPQVKLTSNQATLTASGAGVFKEQTLNLSVTEHAAGGLARGKQLSWLAEEGYPEYVIPTNPSRRNRALSLWEKAGESLGVGEHADGGVVGGLPKTSRGGGKKIEVNVGGITITVGTGGGDIINQLNSSKKQVSEYICSVLSEALEEAFENIPLTL